MATQDGLTFADMWAKVKGYRWSAHTFVVVSGALTTIWITNPEIGAWVNEHASGRTKALITFAFIAYARYSKAIKTQTVPSEIPAGQQAIIEAPKTSDVAVVEEGKK